MKITFWGTRGSIASPGPETVIYGGNTTCLEVKPASGRTIIIDAGTGIRRLGDQLREQNMPGEIHLLLTHIHWDHVLGFPFFAPLFSDGTRILVDGAHRCVEGLKRVFSSDYVDGTWPIRFEDLRARIEFRQQLQSGTLNIENLIIQSHAIQHPQGGMGFKFVEDGRVFVFLTDNELLEDGWVGSKFKDFVAFCKDADVLVHDCQYTSAEMSVRRGWGHSDVNSVAELAVAADVRRLVLFHHDPWRDDSGVAKLVEICAAAARGKNQAIIVEAARENSTLEL